MSESRKVWLKFSVTKGTRDVKFKIVEAPKERLEELVNLIVNVFAKEEQTFRAAGVPHSEEALKEYREYVTTLNKSGLYHLLVCCVDNDDDNEIGDFVAVSVGKLSSNKDEYAEQFQPRTQEFKKLMEMSEALDDCYDAKKINQVDEFYDDRGLVVHPDYRGYGIAQQIFKARRLVCKEHGVPLTGAWMTSYGSQKAAQRDGWEVACTVDRHEFSKKYGVTYDIDAPPSIVYMIAKI